MALKRLLMVLCGLAFAGRAEAAPIGAAIAAVGSLVGPLLGGAGLGGLIVRVAVGFGVSLLQKVLNKQKKSDPVGQVLEIKMGDDQPMSFIVGSRAVGGRRKYIGTWGSAGGTPNAYLVDVIEIANLPSYAGPTGLVSLWIDDKKCTVDWSRPHADGRGYPITEYLKDGKDYLWIKYYDGSQTVADGYLVSKFGTNPDRPYGTDRIGRGVQYVILTARYNTNLFSGAPAGIYEPKPTPFYDPRKDDTNGGSGSQRWGQPATYAATVNPIIASYNIARGIYFDGEWFYGGQNISAHRLPNPAWFAAANECDRLIDGAAQYRCGLEVTVDTVPLDVIEDLRTACAGRFAEVGGFIKPLVGAPGAAVYSFDDDGIVVSKDQDFEPFPSLKATHNRVAGTYPEPAEKWAIKDAPENRNLDLEAEDGNRSLPVPVRFDAVPFSAQVQALINTMVKEQRRFRTHLLTLPPAAAALQPNDVVSWTSVRNAYVNKKFLVSAIAGQTGMLRQASITELDPSDYDPPETILPPVIGWTGPVSAPIQGASGFTATAGSVTDAASQQRRPAIIVTCANDLDDVVRVWVQIRVKATGVVIYDSDANPYGTPASWTLSGAWCLPATDYEVRGRLVPITSRETAWGAWLSVTTFDLREQTDVLDGSITAAKLADASVTASKIMDDAVTSLKLANAAVTTTKLAVSAVTADILANGAVIATKIADSAVTGAKLAAGIVDATKLAASIEPVTVVTALPPQRVTAYVTLAGESYRWNGQAYVKTFAAGEISGQLLAAQIASVAATSIAGQVVGTQIADGSISTVKLIAASVTTAILAAGSVSTGALAAGAVVADKIAASTITGDKIAANSITTALLAAGAVSTAQLAAGAVTTDRIAAGAVSTSKLAVGIGANCIKNSDLSAGLTGWAYEYSNKPASFVWGLRTDTYAPPPGVIEIAQTTGEQGLEFGVQYLKDGSTRDDFSVEAGKWYELSVYYLGHRCNGIQPYIAFMNAAGAVLAYANAGVFPAAQNIDPQKQLSNYQRAWFKAQAPAGSVLAFVFFRMKGTINGQVNSYLWIHKPFFGEATANQTEPSPWSPAGVTLIQAGNIVTGSVTTDALAANAITAAKLAAGSVTTQAIAAGAVTATTIAASAITGDKIAANTIGANQIAAGAITAKSLYLTDYTNLVPNGYFTSSDFSALWIITRSLADDNAYLYGGLSLVGTNVLVLQKTTLSPAHDLAISLNTTYLPPVREGAIYQCEVSWWSNSGTSTGGMYYIVNWFGADKQTVVANSFPVGNAAITAARQRASIRVQAPSGARYAQIVIYSNSANATTQNLLVDYIAFRQANAADLIVDGSITANQLSVNSLSAITANLGTVTAGVIQSSNGKMVINLGAGTIVISS